MEGKLEFELPIECIKRIVQQDYSDAFYFHIKIANHQNEQRTIKMTINKARMISSKINNAYQSDPTINNYDILIPKRSTASQEIIEMKEFEEILTLLLKSIDEKIEISKEKINNFNIICLLLGNSENKENNCQINNIQEAISLLNTELHDESIKYISNRFLEVVESGQLSNIDIKIIEEIIDIYFSNKKENENEFYKEVNQIFSQLTQNQEDINIIMHFLLNIEYQNYDDKMKKYIAFHLSDEIVSNELGRIIQKFHEQLLNENNKETKKSRIIECQYNGNEFSGIFSYLKEKFGSDLTGNKILIFSDAQIPSVVGSVENLIKNDDSLFHNQGSGSAKKSDGWFEFDFCDRKINLNSYTIQTSSSNYATPKSWKIVGSNDRNNWDILSNHVDNSSLKGNSSQFHFECTNKNSNFYRFIRYVQNDSWNRNFRYNITFSKFELFGSISS